jgi:hypothetical protein
LFSAVIATFVIDSYKRLQPDSGDTTAAILMRISDQMAASSNGSQPLPSYQQVASVFQASGADVNANIMWFISLILSISAAIGAVVVQQSTRSYFTHQRLSLHNNAGDVRKQARSHVRKWKAAQRWFLVSALDHLASLLHLAYFLFLVGLTFFLRSVNDTVHQTCFWVTVILSILYAAISLVPVLYPDFPFATPLTTPLRTAKLLITIPLRLRIPLPIKILVALILFSIIPNVLSAGFELPLLFLAFVFPIYYSYILSWADSRNFFKTLTVPSLWLAGLESNRPIQFYLIMTAGFLISMSLSLYMSFAFVLGVTAFGIVFATTIFKLEGLTSRPLYITLITLFITVSLYGFLPLPPFVVLPAMITPLIAFGVERTETLFPGKFPFVTALYKFISEARKVSLFVTGIWARLFKPTSARAIDQLVTGEAMWMMLDSHEEKASTFLAAIARNLQIHPESMLVSTLVDAARPHFKDTAFRLFSDRQNGTERDPVGRLRWTECALRFLTSLWHIQAHIQQIHLENSLKWYRLGSGSSLQIILLPKAVEDITSARNGRHPRVDVISRCTIAMATHGVFTRLRHTGSLAINFCPEPSTLGKHFRNAFLQLNPNPSKRRFYRDRVFLHRQLMSILNDHDEHNFTSVAQSITALLPTLNTPIIYISVLFIGIYPHIDAVHDSDLEYVYATLERIIKDTKQAATRAEGALLADPATREIFLPYYDDLCSSFAAHEHTSAHELPGAFPSMNHGNGFESQPARREGLYYFAKAIRELLSSIEGPLLAPPQTEDEAQLGAGGETIEMV